MRPSTLLPLILTLLTPLVSASACVAGGPSGSVTAAMQCCTLASGTRYQFYANQAICVVADGNLWYYNACVGKIPDSDLDTKCIPGSGPGAFATSTSTARETITATGNA
ncbi:hypothetical protein LSUE1_G009954 [Lachnellula suecica]|uniref:Extracellular membrane protein CFEM domain-containing protein n=1 Tax=Lachnellula suecica TaxID=602035 RepID=A0A8T9BSE8_9HELO|nr:hypothetical protein LSUE1_G009954 [Lachnellula suecica]